MSATCNGCGDCCERIVLSTGKSVEDLRQQAAFYAWKPSTQAQAVQHWHIVAGQAFLGPFDSVKDLLFIAEHWHEVARRPHEDYPQGVPVHECDAFDKATRRCTVHEDKPPICRGFPWYGGTPVAERLIRYARCSYWADVPLEQRPAELAGAFSV